MPKKITLKQWQDHATLRAEFAELLYHPTMQLGISLARDYAEFPIPAPNHPGVNLIHVAALTGSRKEGAIEILLNMETLAATKPAPAAKVKPFERQEPSAEKPKS